MGWKKLFSKSQQREYYVHDESGRKSWNPPNEKVEQCLLQIKQFFQRTKNIGDDSQGFLCFLKETFVQECCTDLAHEKDLHPYTVLDIGCNTAQHIRMWDALGCAVYHGVDSCDDAIKSIEFMNLHGLSTKLDVKCADAAAEHAWIYKNIDLIAVFHTLNYCCSDNGVLQLVVKNISKVLSSRGRCLLLMKEGGSDFEVSTSDGCPYFCVTRDTLKKHAMENGLEVVIDENVAVFACWMGINSPLTTVERSFMYYGTHINTLMKWCKTDTPSGISWLHASKYRFFLLRKPNTTIGNTMRDSLLIWKARLKSGTLGEII